MKTENQNEINTIEAIEDILNSVINGSFTQARCQIADALENGVNLLEALHSEEDTLGIDGKTSRWITMEICKYLAHTPKYEARQAVLNW